MGIDAFELNRVERARVSALPPFILPTAGRRRPYDTLSAILCDTMAVQIRLLTDLGKSLIPAPCWQAIR